MDEARDALDGEARQVIVGARRGAQDRHDRVDLISRAVDQQAVQPRGELLELVRPVVAIEVQQELLHGTVREHDDDAREAVAAGHDIHAADTDRARLGGRRDGGGSGGRRERGRREPEPLLARELDLAELVADHQLLDGGERDGVRDRLDVQAIATVGRHAARARVRMPEQLSHLQLGHDVADRGRADREAVLLDERRAADRLGGGDVFLDDGPQDGRGACLQGPGADLATSQGFLRSGCRSPRR